MDLSFTSNTADMKRLFEQVLMMIKDSAITVQRAAREAAINLSGLILNFESVLGKLTPGQQKLYEEEIVGKNLRTSQEMSLLRSSLRSASNSPAPHLSLLEPLEKPSGSYAFRSSSISSIAQTLATTNVPQVKIQSNTAANGLEYGFIPKDVMSQLMDSTNWRSRATAVQEIEGIIYREGISAVDILENSRFAGNFHQCESSKTHSKCDKIGLL